MVKLPYAVGGYSIISHWWLSYWWLSIIILLVTIDGYFKLYYHRLLVIILL